MWWSVLFGLLLVFQQGTVGSNSDLHVIKKRESSGVLDAIKEEAAKLKEESFDGDVLLLQRLDPGTRTTRYLLASDNSSSIFERHANDRDVEVIVLSSDEDKLPTKGLKRRFVVLRSYQGGPLYHVVYAYLRDFDPIRDRGYSTIGDQWVIEWDTWDYRGPGKERFATFGFTNCGPSAIVPCGYNPVFSPDSSLRASGVKERWVPSSDRLRNSGRNQNLPQIRGEDRYDVDDNFDFYSDLDPSKDQNSGSNRPKSNKQFQQQSQQQSQQHSQPEWEKSNNNKAMYSKDSEKSEKGSTGGSVPIWAGGPSGYFYHSSSTSSVSSSSSDKTLVSGGADGSFIATSSSRGDSLAHESGKKTELWAQPDGSGAVRNSNVEAIEVGQQTGSGMAYGNSGGAWSSVSSRDGGKQRIENRNEGGGRWSANGGRSRRSVLIRSQDEGEHSEEGTKIRHRSSSTQLLEKSAKEHDQVLSDAMSLMSGLSRTKDRTRDRYYDAELNRRDYSRRDRGREESYARIREGIRDKGSLDDRDRSFRMDRNRDMDKSGRFSSRDESRDTLLSELAPIKDTTLSESSVYAIQREKENAYTKKERDGEYRDRDKLFREKERDTMYRDKEREKVYLDQGATGGGMVLTEKERDSLVTGKELDTLYAGKDSLYIGKDKETVISERQKQKMSQDRGALGNVARESENDALYVAKEKDSVNIDTSGRDVGYKGREKATLYTNSNREKVASETGGGDKLSRDNEKSTLYVGKENDALYSGKDSIYSEKDKATLYSNANREKVSLESGGEKLAREREVGSAYVGNQKDTMYLGKGALYVGKEKDTQFVNNDKEKVSLENGGDKFSKEKEKVTAVSGKEKDTLLVGPDSLYIGKDKDTAYADNTHEKMSIETGGGGKLSQTSDKDTLIIGKDRDSFARQGDAISQTKEKDRIYQLNQREQTYREIPPSNYRSLSVDEKPPSFVESSRTNTALSLTQHSETVRSGVGGPGSGGVFPPSQPFGSGTTISQPPTPKDDSNKDNFGQRIPPPPGGGGFFDDLADESYNGGLTRRYKPPPIPTDEADGNQPNKYKQPAVPTEGEDERIVAAQLARKNKNPGGVDWVGGTKSRGPQTNPVSDDGGRSKPLNNGRNPNKNPANEWGDTPAKKNNQDASNSWTLSNPSENDNTVPTKKNRPSSSNNWSDAGPPENGNNGLSPSWNGDTSGGNGNPNKNPIESWDKPSRKPNIGNNNNPSDADPWSLTLNNPSATNPKKKPATDDNTDPWSVNTATKSRPGNKDDYSNKDWTWSNNPNGENLPNNNQKNRPVPPDTTSDGQEWKPTNNGGNPNKDTANEWGDTPVKKNNQDAYSNPWTLSNPSENENNLPTKKNRPSSSNNWSDGGPPENGDNGLSPPSWNGDTSGGNTNPKKNPWLSENGGTDTPPSDVGSPEHSAKSRPGNKEDYSNKDWSNNANGPRNNEKNRPVSPDTTSDGQEWKPTNNGRNPNKNPANEWGDTRPSEVGPSGHSAFFQDPPPPRGSKPPVQFTGRGIRKGNKQRDGEDDNPSSSNFNRNFGTNSNDNNNDPSSYSDSPAHVVAKGAVIANSASIDNKAMANAVDKVGLGAVSNAINGSQAAANSLSTRSGDALSRSETYGTGGARSNSLAIGSGTALGTAWSRGDGDSSAYAVARANGAEANALAARGGNSQAASVSNLKGDSIASSVALKGSSRSSAIANGVGTAASDSLTEGGGPSFSLASARGGGSANSNSQAKDGGSSHSIASTVGNGRAFSTSVTKGGGRTVADAMADHGDSVASAVQDSGEDDAPFDPQTFADRVKKMPDATFKVVNPSLGRTLPDPNQNPENKHPDEPAVYLPGWKTQYAPRPLEPNVTLLYDADPFYGLGSCPHKNVDSSERDEAADNGERLLRYYMTLLRSWCLPKEVKMMKGLLKDGILVVDGTLLKLNLGSINVRSNKLSAPQLEALGIAFEMNLFTQLINERRPLSLPPSLGPSDVRITRSVRFIEDLILKGVSEARTPSSERRHFVHLTRQLILVAKVAYSKLLQDFDTLDSCEYCVLDKELNKNDRTELMAMIQWLIKGLGPVDKGAESAADSFSNFFALNQVAIEARVSNSAN